ncbi:MAG: hypothetical protein OEY14_10185, partial [Myxococcales bacterium]|nr:hypothetical protein [Myxococcales bacterium]
SEILKGQLGYDLDYDFFEDDAFAYGNSLTHRVLGGMSWRFLPQTALVHETRLEFQSFTNTTAASSLVLNGIRVNSTIGLNGAFTNTFSASLVLGYGAGFFGAGNDEYESIIGRAEARWRPKQTLRFSLGYARRYAPSFVGSFYLSDRVYATSQILMGGAFMVGGEASLSYDRTGDALQPDGTLLGNAENREDLRINLEVFGEYRFTNWLGFNATLSYSGDVTNYEFNDMVVMGMSTVPDPGAAYHKFEAWLGARVYY